MSGEEQAPLSARAAAFGRWLHQERELRGLAREDVARLTRLAPAVIESLESGEPARMPAQAYLFGYLRSYATAVGLDPDEAVLRWREVTGAEEELAAGRRRGALPRRVRLGLLLLLALAAAMALGAVLRPRRSPTSVPPASVPPAPPAPSEAPPAPAPDHRQ